jgi:hypothetical protein
MSDEFDTWMEAVDTWCWQLVKVFIYDLADQPFYEWYEDGKTPREAAKLTWQYNEKMIFGN